MFTVYTTAHYADGSHEDCPSDVFETREGALDSLPAGAVCLAPNEWTYEARDGDGDGERQLVRYDFTIEA